ncbi:hypothetical protein [Microvirga brassicacearum]|uniref:Uncharacterized protein n=1 Tax=Microvirga brassicacearum TaxID=2580413 RepID=A0A5N3PEA1_9HYPH|nr:hypothetical protein [Microvirga brassicacearum]KAB0268041.1 hypothetical protein FEZ63_06645 [Microvirga brassicacearum]
MVVIFSGGLCDDAPSIVDAVLTLMPRDRAVPEAAFRPCAFGHCEKLKPVFGEFEMAITRHEPHFRLTPLVGDKFNERVRSADAVIASSYTMAVKPVGSAFAALVEREKGRRVISVHMG